MLSLVVALVSEEVVVAGAGYLYVSLSVTIPVGHLSIEDRGLPGHRPASKTAVTRPVRAILKLVNLYNRSSRLYNLAFADG